MPNGVRLYPRPGLTAIIGKTASSASYLAEFLPEIPREAASIPDDGPRDGRSGREVIPHPPKRRGRTKAASAASAGREILRGTCERASPRCPAKLYLTAARGGLTTRVSALLDEPAVASNLSLGCRRTTIKSYSQANTIPARKRWSDNNLASPARRPGVTHRAPEMPRL
jgi:hypothetical protein